MYRMEASKIKGILLDLDQKIEGEQSIIQLFIKTKNGLEVFEERNFQPYFYVILEDKKYAQELEKQVFGEQAFGFKKVEARPELGENVFAVYFNNTQELTFVRKEIRQLAYVKDKREYDIPFTRRYAFDKNLKPLSQVELTVKGSDVKSIKELPAEKVDLKMLALDIETYSPQRFPNPKEDPVIMLALADDKEQLVLTTKEEASALNNTLIFKTEKEMLKKMVKIIQEKKPDALVTYNGDKFDLPYLMERCRQLKVEFGIGYGQTAPRVQKGSEAVKLKGILHLDAFQMIRLLSRLGVFHLVKMDLESVYAALFGVDKEKIGPEQMTEIWESGLGIEQLVEYNREDAFAALRMAQKYFSIIIALSGQTKMNAFDVLRSSASNLVESLLLGRAHHAQQLAPNKPYEEQVRQRIVQDPFEGGFVKEPLPGLHERIAVLDFRSLYPSMIISHNISPETIDCAHEKCKTGKNLAPTNHWFCEQEPGLLGSVLKDILDKRIAIKKEMKKMKKDTQDFELANAEQYALKILLNSHYGYLAYARSRWYSRECARAITNWAKHYIQDVNEKAEKDGFKALYSDTDSAFLLVPEEKTQDDVQTFAEKINTINKGIENKMLLLFNYRIFNGRKSVRTIKPVGIKKMGRTTCVYGHCYLRNQNRTFAIKRMLKLELTDIPGDCFDC